MQAMATASGPADSRHHHELRRRALALTSALACLLAMLVAAPHAGAAVTCPNANPVVNENNCKGAGTSAWEVNDYSADLGGLHDADQRQRRRERRPEDRAQRARPSPTMTAQVVGLPHGLVRRRSAAGWSTRRRTSTINNDYTCQPMDATTGKVDCGNWQPYLHDPGLRADRLRHLPGQGHRRSTACRPRSPSRSATTAARSRLLYMLPTSTYQAYNIFGGKSLYFGKSTGGEHRRRAPAARSRSPSTARWTAPAATRTGSSGPTRTWSCGSSSRATTSPTPTTSRVAPDADVELRQHNDLRHLRPLGVLDARAVQRRQGGARRRREHRLVQRQHRLLEGPPTRTAAARSSATRPSRAAARAAAAPSATTTGAPTASRAPPTTRSAPTASPAPPTTIPRTRRRRSATTARPPATRARRPAAASGPDMPENQLFGVHVRRRQRRARLPAHGPGRQRQRRVRRRPHLAQHRHLGERSTTTSARTSSAGSGTRSRPRRSTCRASPRASSASPTPTSQIAADNRAGSRTRAAGTRPAAGPARHGQRRQVHGAQRRAGVRRRHDPVVLRPRPTTDARIQQATYNIFSDMGVQPVTPDGVTLDPAGTNKAPTASFTVSSNPTKSQPDGHLQRARRRTTPTARSPSTSGTSTATAPSRRTPATNPDDHAHLLGRGRASTCACASPTTAAPPTSPCARSRCIDNQPPTAAFTVYAEPGVVGPDRDRFNGSALRGPRRHDRQVRVGPRRQRHLRDQHRRDADDARTTYADGGHRQRRPAGHRQRRQDRDHDRARDRQQRRRQQLRRRRARHRRASSTTGAWARRPAPTLRRQHGHQPGHRDGGVTLRRPRRRRRRPQHGGVASTASTTPPAPPSTCRARSKLTVEFWLKWNAYANDDRLAMEFTPNFNDNAGGFLVDPNAPAERRHVRRRPSAAAQRATTSSSPGRARARGTTTPSCSTPRRRRRADHAVRRRPAGALHQARQRHGRRATSPTRRST